MMIILDFSQAIACVFSVVIGAFFAVWQFERPSRKKEPYLDPKYIWYCSVCTYTYINTKDDGISKCPRCQGYNKKA